MSEREKYHHHQMTWKASLLGAAVALRLRYPDQMSRPYRERQKLLYVANALKLHH